MAWFEVAVTSGGGAPQSSIPCIMATGYQYVNTGLAGNRNLTFKFKMKVLVNTPLPFAVLAGNWDVNAYLFQVGGAYPDKFNITYFVGQNSYVTVENISHDDWHNIEVGPGYITVDGRTTTGTAGTHNNTEIKIFGLKTNWSELATVCVGTIEVYENNTLIRKYVPMKDETTTSGYFYDEVNDVSYFSNSNVPLIYVDETTGGNEMHNYSETEQQVGTWIDGSDIYEKTVELPSFTIPTNSYYTFTISDYIQNVDRVIDGTARIYFDNTYAVLPYQAIAGQYYMVLFDANEGQFRFSRNGSGLTITKAYVTLQYTKT